MCDYCADECLSVMNEVRLKDAVHLLAVKDKEIEQLRKDVEFYSNMACIHLDKIMTRIKMVQDEMDRRKDAKH